MNEASAPPTIDFSPAFGSDNEAKKQLVSQLDDACLKYGFFQLVNHGVSSELTASIMKHAELFFNLPVDVKERYDKDVGGFNRGYERLRSQNFEKRTAGDLKEGFYLGRDLDLSHPYVVARKFGQGPNKYPAEVPQPDVFKETMDRYHAALTTLSKQILSMLASNLGVDSNWFADFAEEPIAVLRLLHYPPQPPHASELERGIGAHTDFGALTILLQDNVGGLQIWSRDENAWVDVEPTPGAFVVNLGNMMMRWTNDRYLSNLHRVINKSGKERFSVPFFFSGNPDFLVECLPDCVDEKVGAKYPPIMVQQWMAGRYADTYGASDGKALGELSTAEATLATA